VSHFPPFKIISVCKGGGYRYCRTSPPHPRSNSNGLYPLHRVLLENKLRRFLSPDEVVHHKDGVKSNDAIENLEVVSRAQHSREHQLKPLETYYCGNCGKKKEEKATALRHRKLRSRNKERKLFCSRSCGAMHQHRKAKGKL